MLARRLKSLAFMSAISFLLAVALSSFAHAQTYKVLYSFTGGADGGGVHDGVVMDKQGNLYGATSGGGAYGYGTVFELSPNADGTWTETVLHSFANGDLDGQEPTGTLLIDAAGNLYGTAPGGGLYHGGTVFELTPSSGTWTLTVLYNFAGYSTDVGAPQYGVVGDAKGNLYGPAVGGAYVGGGVFELSPGSSGWTEKVLYAFNSTSSSGSLPVGTPIFVLLGNIYGVTLDGGTHSHGVAYELHKASGWTESELHEFAGGLGDGASPGGGLVFDVKGSLYGVTLQGGGSSCEVGCGTIFKLTKNAGGWKESILHKFGNGSAGASPAGGLVFDNVGNLYGVAGSGGGPCGCGVVFRMSPSAHGAWTYSVLHTFSGGDGAGPVATLIEDGSGNFYGTTVVGGSGGSGVVFEITP